MTTMTLDEFHAACHAQGITTSDDAAFRCPMCGTIQSTRSFLDAGVPRERAEGMVAFSCIGRVTGAEAHQDGTPPGKGCDWTLGGLFHIHKLEVVTPDGKHHARFELATPEEAQALAETRSPA